MSNSSPSPQHLQQEQTFESDAELKVSPSLNQETPNQPDPPPKSDPDAAPPAGHNLDPEYNSPEEEEEVDEEGEEIDEGQELKTPSISSGMPLHTDPPFKDPHESVSDVTLTSPSGDPSTRRGAIKRKKGKGKGKGKGKKQQVIQEKFQTLMENLNPIPFIPPRIFDFANHEKLLRNLGLWDFVHIDFDRSIRVDLIAQLVASYNPKQRASYVNDHRYKVNRADLARAFKLPLKKEKGNVGAVEVDMDWEGLSDDSIGFIVDVLSEWLLLHEDIWVMPDEVRDWMTMIKEGHPEKVDWAGLLWLMVEKELKQGGQLRDCYYASHLQHLMKCQRKDLFLAATPDPEEEVDGEAMERGGEEVSEENAKVVGATDSPREEGPALKGPSTELTLGQDGEKEEEMKDVDMVDGEKWKEIDEEGGGEEQGQWLLKGKNDEGGHFMQPCGAENGEEFGTFEDTKYDDEEMDGEEDEEEEKGEGEEEAGNDFHVYPNEDALEGDGFAGNLLQMGASQVTFDSQDQLCNPSSMDARVDMQHMGSALSFFNNSGKRVIEHDNHITHHSLGDNNKRLRINTSWDNEPMDFGMCLEQIQQMTERARMLYAEKEEATVQSSMNQQLLLNEMQKRDGVIEHLHKARMEEAQKKDREIYRLERELYLMGGVLDGYRKALKDVKKAFGEYKERFKLHEEPTYKDAGDGGLMLTGPELEKLCKKREEDFKMNCLIAEHKVREVEEDLARQFDGYMDKVNFFDERLIGLEAKAKELTEMYVKRRIPPTEDQVAEEKVMEVSEPQPSPEPEEKVLEVTEPQPSAEPEEKVLEVFEPLPSPKSEEVAEVTESPKIAEPEEKSLGVAEPPLPQTEEKGPEVEEPLQNE